MRSHTLIFAAAGLVLGAGLIALLPQDTLFTVSTVHDHAEPVTGERWACPMMDFIGNKPGDCPVCGMKMTKVTAGELTREQQRRMGVELTTVTEGPAEIVVRGYGTADYDNRFTSVVIARVAGRIVKRYMATWGCCETVGKGAPIIDLYSPEAFAAQGELAAAIRLGNQATVQAIKDRFQRWNLAEVAEAVIAGEAPQDIVTIRSPVAGQVVMREFEKVNEMFELGKEIMADTPLLKLVDPDKLTVVIHVPELRANFLREGQKVELASDDRGPLPQIEAKIDRLGREIDPEIRSREVRLYLTGASKVLQPGSLVSARMKGVLGADLHPANPAAPDTWGQFPLIPKTAVISTGVRHVAWRVAGRTPDGRIRFELAPLALGPRIEDEAGNDVYVIRAGLKPGDEVATQGAFLIDSQAQLAGTPSLLFPQGALAPAAAHQH
ncbi:Cation efflux system protein CusB precursor [Lacunisphaera limnophila]|jgi:Cu(I)/Ag(I) efflux system membrane fusion protein|uniref:Cation efflux system protein CusB n=1 Tax=Lacunisphaera limnophila TaxID=1838286 RepID=A0A1D8AT74_9BACT|nr:efflux RND transporter periplasmic adaptor subunit [Lacunisphaera limnophila]AOS44072.1 Cation efflux system protein CusB precursor [Lacunisphaera limnophila]